MKNVIKNWMIRLFGNRTDIIFNRQVVVYSVTSGGLYRCGYGQSGLIAISPYDQIYQLRWDGSIAFLPENSGSRWSPVSGFSAEELTILRKNGVIAVDSDVALPFLEEKEATHDY